MKGVNFMGERMMCDVCGKNEATTKCSECGIPLCEMCANEVTMEDISPGHRVKGVTTPGGVEPPVRKKTVCPSCMKEVDIF